MKVLLTGANGFLGRQVLESCQLRNLEVLACARNVDTAKPGWAKSPDLGPTADWGNLLSGIDVVIHTAGIAHRLGKDGPDLRQHFQNVNVEGTLNLAQQALRAGAKRFIFISSIGVNGAQTTESSCFSEHSIPTPHADYAISKHQAELRLKALLSDSAMELVIIRPPLVYGAHAPGNFQRLLKLVSARLPLPLGRIKNRRSMVALENLADFIAHCVAHPAAANELFLISDGIDVSTPDIVRHLAAGMGHESRLLPVPVALMRYGANLLGKRPIYTQLCGSLAIDSSKARNQLGWTPRLTPEQALFRAGQDYQKLLASRI
ncbi:NAD-dependent epimerase/dehydratase family protein [Pseudomonas sp. AN-1]|uniref:NAD-dependent epimerase/dehydratase family protein n=1 Tax=Pseudomonas sp. AN-1 TaxID=3096605 RepID=UPI002A69FD07|nr:NAD-dependent epimerase/dehydratase family protein [Pseudomonas sp. AN-1]WPP47397.1 NAD-dependent epimerase/dehydratase family protein [Pseudomonas sp. AN-1]